jgi:hypothetical protein
MAPKLQLPARTPRLPLVLQRRSTDEYTPLPYHPINLPVVARVRAEGPEHAARLSMPLADYWSSRQGTAAALRALDEAWGGGFYSVPPEAALDRDAADAALRRSCPSSSWLSPRALGGTALRAWTNWSGTRPRPCTPC